MERYKVIAQLDEMPFRQGSAEAAKMVERIEELQGPGFHPHKMEQMEEEWADGADERAASARIKSEAEAAEAVEKEQRRADMQAERRRLDESRAARAQKSADLEREAAERAAKQAAPTAAKAAADVALTGLKLPTSWVRCWLEPYI